jgi:hypothetical protein
MCYHCANLLTDCTNGTQVEVKKVKFPWQYLHTFFISALVVSFALTSQ